MITAGIDLAAEPAGTALALIEWNGGTARLRTLLVGIDDAAIVAETAEAATVGIDCAFGWPDDFVRFVTAHAAGERHASFPGLGRDGRRFLAYRETDRQVRALTGRWPLSVSTDRLGLTAMHCAALLDQLAEAGVPVDRSGAGRVVEVYPGASLRTWGFDTRGYKTDTGKRVQLIAALREAAPWFDPAGLDEAMVASDDGFDAVVAALAARSHALGLSHPVPPEHRDRARREGWIAVPAHGIDRLLGD